MQKTSKDLFLKHVAQTNPYPLGLEIVKGEGLYLYDVDGQKYTDAIAGIAVSNLGHHHPVLVEAAKNQLDAYMHALVYGEFVLGPQTQLATALAKHLPQNLNCTFFVNSGTEATEGALKLAKRITGRTKLVACHKAYHGSTHGALSLISKPEKTAAFRPLLPCVEFLNYNAIEDLVLIDENTACVVMETVQAGSGVTLPNEGYLQAVRARCDEVGALLIFDEIQVGMGRTGTLFAFEHYGVVPDILLLAKALGGGMPLGAFISSYERMQLLTKNPMLGHITTFGGHPVCCATGLASLNYISSTGDLLSMVDEKGQLFYDLLHTHQLVKEVRRSGLLIGIDFGSAALLDNIVDAALEAGIISGRFLFNETSMRLAPPLNISKQQIYDICATLVAVFDKV